MDRNGGGATVRMLSERHGCPVFGRPKSRLFEGRGRYPFPARGEGESYRDLLDADQFEGALLTVLLFEAELDDLADALHQCVEVLGLSVTTVESRNCGDEVAFFVLLNQYREFPLGFQFNALSAEVYHVY